MSNSPYIPSGPTSRYGSPLSSQCAAQGYQTQSMESYHGYGSPAPVHGQPLPYSISPHYSTLMRGASTPPTSSHSQDGSSTGRRSRRTTPSQRKKNNADPPKVPQLDKPLSEITKDMKDTPVRDMEEWVNRSAEDRRKEAEKRNGYITRPMNSFMLYRSAYADRTKLWCLQNNHQVVSAVSGKSWPMEPAEVRDFYNELARLERDNHQKAHPGYKFSPSKATTSVTKKRKGLSDDGNDDDELGSIEDDDFEYRPSTGNKRRTHPANRTATPDLSYPSYAALAGPPGPQPYAMHAPDPLEVAYGGGYYETRHDAGPFLPDSVQDVHYVRQPYPVEIAAHQQQSVVGLPSTDHYDLVEEHLTNGTTLPFDHAQLDPMLMSYAGQQAAAAAASTFSDQGFREFDQDVIANMHAAYPNPPGAGTQPVDQWTLQVPQSRSEIEKDFERIMKGEQRDC